MELGEITQAVIVPIIVGLVAVARSFGPDDRYLPVLALLLGVAGAFVFPEAQVAQTVVKGLIFGLAASGLWSQGKTYLAK